MPVTEWSTNLFDDRLEIADFLLKSELPWLIANQKLKVLQASKPVATSTWKLLNHEFFPYRPDVQLRVYGFYSEVCDLSFTSQMTNVRHFSADCLMDAQGLDHLAKVENLESLGIGIYHLDGFEFLDQVTPQLKRLFLGWTRSTKPSLAGLSRFTSLEEIYLEGHQKQIEVISSLTQLKKVVLRSISTADIHYLIPLEQMWSLEIKLGGIRDLSAIQGMPNIKYLELWRVRGLSDIGVISSLPGLQLLSLQALTQVTALPSFNQSKRLRRITLANLKSLQDISSLEFAPALEDFIHWGAQNMQPEDYLPLLDNPKIRRVLVEFGSKKKNMRFEAIMRAHHLDPSIRPDLFIFD